MPLASTWRRFRAAAGQAERAGVDDDGARVGERISDCGGSGTCGLLQRAGVGEGAAVVDIPVNVGVAEVGGAL